MKEKMRHLISYLTHPLVKDIDISGDERMIAHKKILTEKKMLQSVFGEFHRLFKSLADKHLTAVGSEVELGAGVSPIRDTYPDVIASDISHAAHLDLVLDAQNMNLDNESIAVIYGQNCFHHFPDPDLFFDELERVLITGGGCILLDPYYGPFANFIFKRLFKTEGFDRDYPEWITPQGPPMFGANQALSYIVFVRDVAEFKRKHPSLEIVHRKQVNNYLRYLLSGGLNFRKLLPDALTKPLQIIETLLYPISYFLALHHVIVIKKN